MADSPIRHAETLLRTVLTAVEISSSGTWRWRPGHDPSSPSSASAGHERPVAELAEALYWRFFHHRQPSPSPRGGSGGEGSADRRRYLGRLALCFRQPWTFEGGWRVVEIPGGTEQDERQAGRARVRAEHSSENRGLVFDLGPDDFIAPEDGLAVGREIRVRVPRQRHHVRPGVLRWVGAAGGVEDAAPIFLCWNLRPGPGGQLATGPETWLEKLGGGFDGIGSPYRLELPDDPAALSGAAELVAVLPGNPAPSPGIGEDERWAEIWGLVARVHTELASFLRDDHAFGFARLARGLAVGRGSGELSAAAFGLRLFECVARVASGRESPEALAEALRPTNDLARRLARSGVTFPHGGEYSRGSGPITPTVFLERAIWAAAAMGQDRTRQRIPFLRGSFLLGGLPGSVPDESRAGSLHPGLHQGGAGLALILASVHRATRDRWPAKNPDLLEHLDRVRDRTFRQAASFVEAHRLSRLVPHDLLDFRSGDLAVLWALAHASEPLHEAEEEQLRTVHDGIEALLERIDSHHAFDPRAPLALLDLASFLERSPLPADGAASSSAADLAARARGAALRLGEGLLERRGDRLLAGSATARDFALHALAFHGLWAVDGEGRFLHAAREAVSARVRPSRLRARDAIWPLLASLVAARLDPTGPGPSRVQGLLESVSELLARPTLAHDLDTSLDTGACGLVLGALEASRRLLPNRHASAGLARAAHDLLERLLWRHGETWRWPTAFEDGRPHPGLGVGEGGVILTLLAAASADSGPFVLVPGWELLWSCDRRAEGREKMPEASSASAGLDRVAGSEAGFAHRSPGQVILDVPRTGQQMDNWCWATVDQMLGSYLRPETLRYQDQIVAEHFGGRLRNRGTWPDFDGLGPLQRDLPPSWDEIREQIEARRPMAITWRYPRAGGGHMVAVVGYLELETGHGGSAAAERFLWVHDPWPPFVGETYLLPYGEYAQGAYPHWRTYLMAGVAAAGKAADPRPVPVSTRATRPRAWAAPWDAARAGVASLRALAESGTRGSADRQGPSAMEVLFEHGEAAAGLTISRRPIRQRTVTLRDLRRHGRWLLETAAHGDGSAVEEMIFPVLAADGALVSSVTVVRTDRGWQLRQLGRRTLASALFCLRNRPIDLRGAFGGYLPNLASAVSGWTYEPPKPTPDFAFWIPELYQLFLGARVDWPRRRTILIPVYDSERFGFRSGEALVSESVFDALQPYL